jgi:hypothetical protein
MRTCLKIVSLSMGRCCQAIILAIDCYDSRLECTNQIISQRKFVRISSYIIFDDDGDRGASVALGQY